MYIYNYIYIVIYCAVSQKFALWHFLKIKYQRCVSFTSAQRKYSLPYFFKLFFDFLSNGLERPKGVLFSL